MTADPYFDEFKTCPACEHVFFRPRSCSPSTWAKRVTCSNHCARQHDPAPPVVQPAPQPRRGGGDQAWRRTARCRDANTELFFPVGTTGPALQQIAEAKSVCFRCPVRGECLEWAVGSGQEYGIFGGMDQEERRRYRRRTARFRVRTA